MPKILSYFTILLSHKKYKKKKCELKMTPTLCSLVVSTAAALLSLDLDAVALRVVRQVGAVDVEDVG